MNVFISAFVTVNYNRLQMNILEVLQELQWITENINTILEFLIDKVQQ